MLVSSRSSLLSRLPVLFGLLLLCLSVPAIHFYAESLSRELVVDRLSQRTHGLLDARQTAIREEIGRARRFFGLVAASPLINDFIEAKGSAETAGVSDPPAAREIARWFLGTLDYSPAVEQVRIVSRENDELVRVDRENGIPRIVWTTAGPRQDRDDYVIETLKSAARRPGTAVGAMAMEYREFDDPPTAVLRSAAPLFRSNGELFGLVIAKHSARKVLFDPGFMLEPGLQYHVLDAQGDWIAQADGTGSFSWRLGSTGRWEERYEAAPAGRPEAAAQLQRYRGPGGPVLVAETAVRLEGDTASALTLRLVTEPRWLAGELASLHWRLAAPAYLLLALVYLSWFLLWLDPRRHSRNAGADVTESTAPARREVSDEKEADAKAERALRERLIKRNEELERQFRERTAELEAAKDLAMSSNEIKSEFIANVSHELRTPLHGIAGTLRLLRQDPLNERQQYNLLLAEESVLELTTIINSIIDVSKLEADRLSIEETDISLLAVVDDMAQRFAPRAAEKGLGFVIDDIDLGGELVLGDGDRIARIISILLENAIKYTDGGSVRARFASSISDDGEMLFECTVTDTGRGISPQQQARLFHPFPGAAPESASSTAGGIGLGLVIAKQLCNLMFGDLELDSSPGEGTECVFRIRLRLSEQQPEGGDAFRPLAGKEVTLVQEDALTCAAIRRLFESRGALVADVPGLYQIDDARWNEIDFLVLDLDAFDREADFVAERTSRGMDESAIIVLATAVASMATVERERELPDNVHILPLPATTVGLDAALLSTNGERARHRDHHFDPLSDASHDVWSVLPDITALVVDDNKVNQHVVGGLLEEYGAKVEYAANGQEVIDLLLRKVGRVFDVILMDCQMPVMDGYEATRRIRAGAAGEEYVDVPIIAVTAAALGGDRMKCLDAGMTDYIVKPVKPSALERLILQHVPRGEVTQPDGADAGEGTSDGEEDVRSTLATRLRHRQDWNREAFKGRVMGNVEIVHTIAEMYLENAPQLIDRMLAGVEAQDYRDVRAAAHELSGMSENLGAEKMAAIAQEIELAALDRRTDDLQYLLGELRGHFDRVEDVARA